MTEFKVGDRVTVKDYPFDSNAVWNTHTGTVKDVWSNSVTVEFTTTIYKNGTFASEYLVLAETERKPGELRVGDKVRLEDKSGTVSTNWIGVEGVVEEGSGLYGNVRVRLTKAPKPGSWNSQEVGYVASLNRSNLVLAEKPFTFEDIQEGDKIRRTKVYKSGATEVREGVVNQKGSSYWSQDSLILAYAWDHEPPEGVTYELLDRPKPKAIWEDAAVGTNIRRKQNGAWNLYTKEATGWKVFYGDNGTHRNRSDWEIDIILSGEQDVELVTD